MVIKVEMFQASNGQLFETEKQAVECEKSADAVSVLCSNISAIDPFDAEDILKIIASNKEVFSYLFEQQVDPAAFQLYNSQYRQIKDLEMAFVSQEFKKEVAPVVKEILQRYGLKGSLSIRNHMTLVLTISAGKIDFLADYNKTFERPDHCNYIHVNTYWYQKHFTNPVAVACLEELVEALKTDKYFDESDAMTDYFHCSHYIDINIGRWDKPYKLVA